MNKMNKKIIVLAPHPDDETMGCGGTLLRHAAEGDKIHWLILTGMKPELGFSPSRMESRAQEIQEVTKQYGFSSVHSFQFPTTRLDTIPLGDIVQKIATVFQEVKPEVVYLPSRSDVHSDHRVAFDAGAACTKWFRHPSVKRVLAYEALSETEFAIDPTTDTFRPNVFVNIEKFLQKKLDIMKLYASELGDFPFPRSEETIRALASLRGSSSGTVAAEAFMLLRDIL